VSRTRIKICGITNSEDARQAAAAGADAIGLVFYPSSPRFIDAETAQRIVASLPPFVTTVGLFVDATTEQVADVLSRVPLDLLQFHGQESEPDCRRHGRPYLKALRVRPGMDVAQQCAAYPSACGILLDAYRKGVPGGTGAVFDWDLVPHDLAKPIILAGGLHPGNVADAIRAVRPHAVDVSSGVEISPGRKSRERLEAFFTAVAGVAMDAN